MQMMHRFQNRYRIESSRLSGWDYSQPGLYFVTICVADRNPILGKVVSIPPMATIMEYSLPGAIVADEWCHTKIVRPNVHLDDWVVMPDHLHGIVMIEKSSSHSPIGNNVDSQWKPGTLGVIINQFKSMCTKRIHAAGFEFKWQPRFHDHIIRNEQELTRIQEYIRNNPAQWNQEQSDPKIPNFP
jgi:putative transposase